LDSLAGVDYTAENNDEPGDNDDQDDERDDYQEDAELDDEDAYDQVDQSEIDELLAEPGVDTATNQEANPTDNDEPEQANAAKAAVMPGVREEPIVSDEGSEQTEDTIPGGQPAQELLLRD
jgi:hypothetical protein